MSAGQEHGTSAFFASQAAASEAVNRLTRAGFHEHEIESQPLSGGAGVRVTVSAEGDRRSHAMRVLDDDGLIQNDERAWRDRSESWLPRGLTGRASMGDIVHENPLLAVGITFLAGMLVGMLARRT